MTTTELRATPRGFLKGEFVDHFGATCSIQESSVDASEGLIWLGSTETTDAGGEVTGVRMHLTQTMVRDLLPLLRRFAETGHLADQAESDFRDVRRPLAGYRAPPRDAHGRFTRPVSDRRQKLLDQAVKNVLRDEWAWEKGRAFYSLQVAVCTEFARLSARPTPAQVWIATRAELDALAERLDVKRLPYGGLAESDANLRARLLRLMPGYGGIELK